MSVATRRAPTSLDNIPRIPAPSPEVLDHRYLRRGEPVILTGLFDGAPVTRLADPAVARAELGGLPLPIRPNPITELLHGRDPSAGEHPSTFAAFTRALATGRSQEFCIEHDTPDAVASYLPDLPYLDLGDQEDGWVSHMFLAGPGAATHLHFDADKRNVITYQVFGHKRYVLVDPAQTRKLAPGSPPAVCYASALYLEHFSEADLRDFLRYVGAWDCVLEPGEALVTPSGFWHYIEYVDVALSVTFRLPRNPYVQFLATTTPATSVELQALASCFRDEDAVTPAAQAAFDDVRAVASRSYAREEDRGAALDRLYVELCQRLALPIAGVPYHVADIERRHRMARGSDELTLAPGAVLPASMAASVASTVSAGSAGSSSTSWPARRRWDDRARRRRNLWRPRGVLRTR